VHGLTPAEYQTVRAILDHPMASERERIASSGVPGSTYSTARRRVFAEGWLTDLMIPNPGPTGFQGVEMRLIRPSIAERRVVVEQWSTDPEGVVLWEGIHVVFAIFFRRGTDAPRKVPREGPGPFQLHASRSEGTIPVFFDYSGVWDHFGGSGPPTTYPAGLDLTSPPVGDRTLAASDELMQWNGDPSPGSSHWVPILRSSRRHRDVLDVRVVQPRTVLDPAKVPPFEGRRLGEVIFVQGVLRSGKSVRHLLEVLTAECGVYPFLLAEAEGKVLMGGIGQTFVEGPGRIPAPSARAPVAPVLTEHLDHADVFLEPGESLRRVVNHRYGPVGRIPPDGPGTSS
jgi:hypothetical protein